MPTNDLVRGFGLQFTRWPVRRSALYPCPILRRFRWLK